MTLLEAVYTRRSRRSFLKTSLPDKHRQELLRQIALLNLEYDLHIQLIENAAPVFAGFRASYGMFQNVEHFIALIGRRSDPLLKRKLGYCGEECRDRLIAMIKAFGLPTETEFTASQLAKAMLADKKRSGSVVDMIIPEIIGRCVIKRTSVDELESFVAAGL